MFGTGTNTSWHKFKRNVAKVKAVLLFWSLKSVLIIMMIIMMIIMIIIVVQSISSFCHQRLLALKDELVRLQ